MKGKKYEENDLPQSKLRVSRQTEEKRKRKCHRRTDTMFILCVARNFVFYVYERISLFMSKLRYANRSGQLTTL
jgi:hypothetical protein